MKNQTNHNKFSLLRKILWNFYPKCLILPLLALIGTIALCIGCTHQVVGNHNIEEDANDAAEIYGKFLDNWTSKEKDPINISITAKAPSADDLKQFSDCTDKGTNIYWVPAESIDDLSNFVAKLPYVRLVDPDTWSPRDPGDLISQGQSVESAVKTGFANGLMTFSAITFDESRKTAAFKYSFVCGSLCGSGGTAIFIRTQDGWAQSTKQCDDGWISYHQRSRPNIIC